MNRELTDLMAFLASQPSTQGQTLAERRAGLDRAEKAMPLPDGMTAAAWSHGDLRGQWLTGRTQGSGRVILYLHGGGFQFGSSRSHRHLAGAIAHAVRSDALVLDYRLAPEHRFPAGLDDAIAAYALLLERHRPRSIVVAGDSAGGGLAVSMLVAARDRGLAMPAALVCLSPWIDLTCPIPTAAELQKIADPMVQGDDMPSYAKAYLSDTSPTHPLATPTCGSLAGFPAALIQVGSGEWLLRDSVALARALEVAGGEVVLEIEPDAPHVWQWFWPRLKLARDSIGKIGEFLEPRFNVSEPSS